MADNQNLEKGNKVVKVAYLYKIMKARFQRSDPTKPDSALQQRHGWVDLMDRLPGSYRPGVVNLFWRTCQNI